VQLFRLGDQEVELVVEF